MKYILKKSKAGGTILPASAVSSLFIAYDLIVINIHQLILNVLSESQKNNFVNYQVCKQRNQTGHYVKENLSTYVNMLSRRQRRKILINTNSAKQRKIKQDMMRKKNLSTSVEMFSQEDNNVQFCQIPIVQNRKKT